MLAKHVGFQPLTFATLSRLYNTLTLLLRNTQNNEMLGKLIEGTLELLHHPIGHFTDWALILANPFGYFELQLISSIRRREYHADIEHG